MSSIKKYKEYEKKLWKMPLAGMLFVICIPRSHATIQMIGNNFWEDFSVLSLIGFFLWLGMSGLLVSIIPFFGAKIIIRAQLNRAIENCTITSMRDFEYYREKLTGLSPATISILTDLEIEQQKDVTASILQYENLGILKQGEDHAYYITEKGYAYDSLNESDRYLIEHLVKGDFDMEHDTCWKQLAMEEAVSEGYVTRADRTRQENADGSGRKRKNIPPGIWFVFLMIWSALASNRLSALDEVFETMPEHASFARQMQFFLEQPLHVQLGILESVAIFFCLMYFVAYFFVAPRVWDIMGQKVRIRRTDYGNQMAECVYGMKNFIHDYSNLSEADKRQVIIWEDYLVYAVVLEENQRIVNEIFQMRSEMLRSGS